MIMSFFKKYLIKMYGNAMILNDKNVCSALSYTWPHKRLLDVWCRDGEKTQSYIYSAQSVENYGIELIDSAAKKANQKWIQTMACYADQDIRPFEDDFFDVVVSNQVIEHLSDVDKFIGEAYRVLKPWWHLITSTNNLSSWHNIFALLFGWAPFDLTNSSKKVIGIGNPLAVHQWEVAKNGDSWTHKCIYTTRWLNDWFSKFWLKAIKNYWSGYYPLWAVVGSLLKRHCAFITLINKK
jgi:2-polyprenyl-3-methyl-5-hydroxy-6-metoxy-1,4-benzoquinol methylase